MARIRTIKPEFPQSESMGRVSRDARLLFVMLWTICDDAGKARGNSRMLASLLYPYDSDAGKLMDRWMGELEREHCVTRYEVEGNSYVQISKWLDHQKIDKPSKSKFPSPSNVREDSRQSREASSEEGTQGPKDQGRDQGEDSICAAPSQALALVVDNPCLISLPTNRTDETFSVLQSNFDQYQALYPAADVAQELRAMAAWLISNPKNVKTKSGTPRFINSWLSKAQNRSKPNGHGSPSKNDNWLAGAVELAAEIRSERR